MNDHSSTEAVSVCMATFNGGAYVEEQVRSILEQLSPTDELIVVDDHSTDDTVQKVEAFLDPRVFVHRNERNRGHVFTFERAIRMARHSFILLADQDDRWVPGRLRLLVEALRGSKALVVSSNSDYMDAAGSRISCDMRRVTAQESRRHFRNIMRIFAGRSGYYGCAMAFRRNIVPVILPIPEYVEAHDLWIALASNLLGSNLHIEASTLARRIHGGNASLARRSLYKKLRSRTIFARCIIELARRSWKPPWTRQLVDG
jgi:glycosyltransferase involved in cell wall biosynthesis